MKIETKYSVGDKVWRLNINNCKAEEVEVSKLSFVAKSGGVNDGGLVIRTETRYGVEASTTVMCDENELFPTKEALIASL